MFAELKRYRVLTLASGQHQRSDWTGWSVSERKKGFCGGMNWPSATEKSYLEGWRKVQGADVA